MAEYGTKTAETDESGMTEDELIVWKARILVALDYQKKLGNQPTASGTREGRWDVNIKALDGDFNSRTELGEEAIDVNVTHSTVQTLLSPFWVADPYITVAPTREKFEDASGQYDNIVRARTTEYEINYWLRELQLRQVGKKSIIDAFATNCGYAYLGYIADKADVQDADGDSIEPNPLVRFKQPFIKRIPPKDVLMPPGFYDIEDCPWIAIRWRKPCSYVKERYKMEEMPADEKYDDIDLDKMEGVAQKVYDYLKSDDAGYCSIYQVWDKTEGKLCTIHLNCEYVLEVTDWPFDIEGFPVEKLRLTFTPDQGYGTPSMSMWMPQQKEANAARTATRIRENRTKSVVFMDADLPSEVEEAYKKAQDGGIVKVPTDGGDIRTRILIDPGLPPAMSAYQYGSVSIQDLYQISGLGAQQRGSGDPNIGSATASALVDKWAQIRTTDFGDCIRTFYLNIARKLWMILKNFPDQKRDLLVMGAEGTMQRMTYTLAELKGEFAFTMDVSTMMVEDPITKMRNAAARYNLLRQDPLVNGQRLISDLLDASNIYDQESYFTRLMSPDQELQKFMAGLPVEANELDDQQAHLQAHTQQAAQIHQAVDQMDPNSPDAQKLRVAMILLMGNVNDHHRILAEIEAKTKPQAGAAVQSNTLRQDAQPPAAGETDAEMAGGQVGAGPAPQSPDGLPMGA